MANLRFKRIQLESQDENSTPEIEEWRDIKDYPGYQISNFGRARSFWSVGQKPNYTLKKPQRILRLHKRHEKFSTRLSLQLKRKDGKLVRRYVNVIVLTTFVGPKPHKMQCCHNDGNASNNHISNLRWDTCLNNHADMVKHGNSTFGIKNPMSKLNDQQVVEIRDQYAQGKFQHEIAKSFGVARSRIAKIVTGLEWKHVGGPTHKPGEAADRSVHTGSKNGRAILNEELVSQIKQKLRNGEKQIPIAKEFGVGKHVISEISQNRAWKHVK
jgi:hypothetical protein